MSKERQITITARTDDNDEISAIEIKSNGFTYFELISILEISKLQVINRQPSMKPE